mgnify:CR=1 FL=1
MESIYEQSYKRTYIRKREIQRRKLLHQRIFVAAIVVIIAIVIACLSFSDPAAAYKENNQTQMQSIIIEKGDTLWSVAKVYYPKYEGDIRQLIYEIKKINDMETSAIYDGQILYLPNDIYW